MIFPTVHRGGTSQERLLEQLMDAITAIHDAESALKETAPNERDYYTQGPKAFELARSDYVARMRCLVAVRDELQEIAEHVADAG